MTTTNESAPSIEVLDLRPALKLRTDSELAIARLRSGDRDPELLTAARALLDQEEAIVTAVNAALSVFGDPESLPRAVDNPAFDVINPLATGQLGYVLDVVEGRVEG